MKSLKLAAQRTRSPSGFGWPPSAPLGMRFRLGITRGAGRFGTRKPDLPAALKHEWGELGRLVAVASGRRNASGFFEITGSGREGKRGCHAGKRERRRGSAG